MLLMIRPRNGPDSQPVPTAPVAWSRMAGKYEAPKEEHQIQALHSGYFVENHLGANLRRDMKRHEML